jgi:mono/diheme cytochrome c family protein
MRANRLPGISSLIAVTIVSAGCATVGGPRTSDEDATVTGGGLLTTNDGVFTVQQADRGKRVYDTYCFNCHPAQFYEARLPVWADASVERLFDAMSSTMPEENPGVLSTGEYLDVLAYIFSITGAPAGDAELTMNDIGTIAIVSE